MLTKIVIDIEHDQPLGDLPLHHLDAFREDSEGERAALPMVTYEVFTPSTTNPRYRITLSQIGRSPDGDITVHEGDDHEQAEREYRNAVDRSQGEWTNHVFLGQSVTLYNAHSGKTLDAYIGAKELDLCGGDPDHESERALRYAEGGR